MITKNDIIEEILDRYSGLTVNQNWGETGIFYNPQMLLTKGIYLLTFKEKDGKNDQSSNLDRSEDLFRLNLGISKQSFIKLFGNIPSRPSAGNVVEMDYDFSEINKIMPHPIYSWMAWACVISPSRDTFNSLLPLIDEGYQMCLKKYAKKKI